MKGEGEGEERKQTYRQSATPEDPEGGGRPQTSLTVDS